MPVIEHTSAEEMKYWRLAEALSLAEAAALICGILPSLVRSDINDYEQGWVYVATTNADSGNDHFHAALRSLLAAIEMGTLSVKARLVLKYPYAQLPDGERVKNLDPTATMVSVEDLRAWLDKRGMRPAFFSTAQTDPIAQPGYLDHDHQYYAPKLAAAIRAWEAVISDPEKLRGKTPKQALIIFLTEHASEYGLINEDGIPSSSVIEELAKAANWKPEGGVGKTPGH
jgi:hypothetical protein